MRGRLKHRESELEKIVVGDSVELSGGNSSWTIESVAGRRTLLARRGRGGTTGKLIAANVDTAFAVISVREPRAKLELADRLLVLAEAGRLRPVLVVNKIDLPDGDLIADSLLSLYRTVGYRALKVSATTGTGLSELVQEMSGSLSTLIGPSGVGKSSLLNAIKPSLGRRTAPVSGLGTGRHTTVSSRIVSLVGGASVADTPGFANVKVWGLGPAELVRCFPELRRLSPSCRFRDCAHIAEPDCAVREAVGRGTIEESRYRSYLDARTEAAEALPEWSAARADRLRSESRREIV